MREKNEIIAERCRLVGSRIKQLRMQKRISQSDLAKAIKVSQPHLSNIERGETHVTLYNLLILIDKLGVSMSEFFSGIEKDYNKDNVKKSCNDPIDIDDLIKAIEILKTKNRA
ncbi:MAG: helix-turn-helix transcriptional regulator [Phascolarctobacterium sp.]|nr:helix-turn-helix transcriptional regulator [Phascolarctobacterium sp.]